MKKIASLLIILNLQIFSQTELIESNHIIFDNFKMFHTLGKLDSYDDIILPLSQSKVNNYLSILDSNKFSANLKFSFDKKPAKDTGFFEEPLEIFDNFGSNYEQNFISYSDSMYHFSANPLLSAKFINNSDLNNSLLIIYGGKIKFSYGKTFGAFLEAYNGYIGGNIDAAKLDKRVSQSFSVNQTKIKYFDGTRGYLNYENGGLAIFAGRNEITWGINSMNPMVLGNYAQNMDFFKLSFQYKKFNYTYLHGWLVTPRTSVYVDSLIGDVRNKGAKYIVINRIGFIPTNRIRLGISQSIIYANRPVELAYLNPFLLWESAQRSLNDLDNSFLNIDFRYLIVDGLEVLSSITFDDLNFNLWGAGEWNTPDNRFAWQVTSNIAYPFIFKNFLLTLDYIQIRPFTFTHPGVNESLSYTNNGNSLGLNLLPNSINFSSNLMYLPIPNLAIHFRYDNIKHGDNLYDESGNLLFNYGGSYSLSTTSILSDLEPKLLDGVFSNINRYSLQLKYYYSYFINGGINIVYENMDKQGMVGNNTTLMVYLNYNLY